MGDVKGEIFPTLLLTFLAADVNVNAEIFRGAHIGLYRNSGIGSPCETGCANRHGGTSEENRSGIMVNLGMR